MTIKFYRTKDPYGFMGNFYRARMFIYGRWWNWVEAPYQAAKTNITEEKQLIWETVKPMEVRNIGQTVTMVSNWDEIKRSVMKECCMAKFLQHADLRRQLLETTDDLMEDSPIDAWWGCGKNGDGRNELGKILMEIREELKGE